MSRGTNRERLEQNNAKIEELIEKLNEKSVTNGKYNIEVIEEADGTQTLNITDWDYVPKPSFDRVFANNSWTQIAEASKIIKENNYTSAQVKEIFGWGINTDTKVDIGTDGVSRIFHFSGFNHDDLSDGSGKAGITFGMVDCEPVLYPMNDAETNAGGYPLSLMRNSTLPTIFSLLSLELQSVIKKVNKISANGGGGNSTGIVTTSENIFLFSEIEINGYISNSTMGSSEGSVYEYFEKRDIYKKYDADGDGVPDTEVAWWLRSTKSASTTQFVVQSKHARPGFSTANKLYGLSYGLCI